MSLADLITWLEAAQRAGHLVRRLRTLVFPSLMVIDEIGYLPIHRAEMMMRHDLRQEKLRLEVLGKEEIHLARRVLVRVHPAAKIEPRHPLPNPAPQLIGMRHAARRPGGVIAPTTVSASTPRDAARVVYNPI